MSMNAREIIERMRAGSIGGFVGAEEMALLADLAEEGLVASRELVESESTGCWIGLVYWRNLTWCRPDDPLISLLDRAGEIERKEGAPHLIRFKEPT